MGLSGSKTTTTNKPIYSGQIEGAENNINSAYATAAPKIQGISDQLGGLVPGLIERYTNGDPTINAAKGYDASVLSGQYLHGSPQLDALVAQTNNDVANRTSASLGTRGLVGGSAMGDIISRALAQNETGLRYTDYNNERSRMDAASGRAPGLAAASELPLASLTSILQAQQAPLQAAVGAGSGIGGLLGQYTTSTQKNSGLGSLIARIVARGAQAYAGGGFGG